MRRASHKRATRQLEAVFQALQGDPSHPFADEIYRRVRKKLPRISLATVYRNLQRLVEDGKIRAFLLGERVARYDPETNDHDHFICESCGRIIDLFLERLEILSHRHFAADRDGEVAVRAPACAEWDVNVEMSCGHVSI